ncbi:MAG: hypothetical protein IIB83_09180 [Bacteroidetes bacterium]|nr:hypothetical protein [Bacteroidota bacterium]
MYEKINVQHKEIILETESVAKISKEIQENCYIIAEFPMVLTSISNMKGLATIKAIKNPQFIEGVLKKGDCVYYFYDGFCSKWPISGPLLSMERCQKMLEIFNYTEKMHFERDKLTTEL